MQSKTMTLSRELVIHFVRFLSLQLLCINLVVNCYWCLIALVLDLSVYVSPFYFLILCPQKRNRRYV